MWLRVDSFPLKGLSLNWLISILWCFATIKFLKSKMQFRISSKKLISSISICRKSSLMIGILEGEIAKYQLRNTTMSLFGMKQNILGTTLYLKSLNCLSWNLTLLRLSWDLKLMLTIRPKHNSIRIHRKSSFYVIQRKL